MPMWNLTQEKKDQLCKNRDTKQQELKKLQGTTIETLWERDLDEFLAKLNEVEEKERLDAAQAEAGIAKSGKKAKGKGAKGMVKTETLPSEHAIRVEPIIAVSSHIKRFAKIQVSKILG